MLAAAAFYKVLVLAAAGLFEAEFKNQQKQYKSIYEHIVEGPNRRWYMSTD